MRRNIIIAGVPRAGKSTVCNMISKRYGHHHISMDSIIAGFERVFPENGINTYADMPSSEILRNISGKIAPFIAAMIDSGEYDEFDERVVIDIFQLLPEDYLRCIGRERCDIYYFITSDVSADERYAILKRHDTPRDYTYGLPESKLRGDCADLVADSRWIRAECEKYALPYFETANNREDVLNAFLNSLDLLQ